MNAQVGFTALRQGCVCMLRGASHARLIVKPAIMAPKNPGLQVFTPAAWSNLAPSSFLLGPSFPLECSASNRPLVNDPLFFHHSPTCILEERPPRPEHGRSGKWTMEVKGSLRANDSLKEKGSYQEPCSNKSKRGVCFWL